MSNEPEQDTPTSRAQWGMVGIAVSIILLLLIPALKSLGVI
ncbi:hypothetical protein [Shewanella sp. Isolate11]|nr:hypothetical protein [Shewanella sp. Isolate11]